MANYDCSACETLREDNPNFIVNGMTDTECTNLKNDVGLSGDSDDCTDLDLVNDCLVGNMAEEVDAYDVCDWKPFMKKFIPNVWTTLKGIICAICGIWTNIHDLRELINALCEQVNYNYAPPVARYGTLPNTSYTSRVCGTINTKGGNALLVPMTYAEVQAAGLAGIWDSQNAGIMYGRLQTISCSTSACKLHEWIAPGLLLYKLHSSVAVGDILWSCSKSDALNVIGMSQELWDIFAPVGYTWKDYWMSNRKGAYIRIGIENNNLVLQYLGTTYPNASLTQNEVVEEPENPYRLYVTNC